MVRGKRQGRERGAAGESRRGMVTSPRLPETSSGAQHSGRASRRRLWPPLSHRTALHAGHHRATAPHTPPRHSPPPFLVTQQPPVPLEQEATRRKSMGIGKLWQARSHPGEQQHRPFAMHRRATGAVQKAADCRPALYLRYRARPLPHRAPKAVRRAGFPVAAALG